jgi:hypothetical protein
MQQLCMHTPAVCFGVAVVVVCALCVLLNDQLHAKQLHTAYKDTAQQQPTQQQHKQTFNLRVFESRVLLV